MPITHKDEYASLRQEMLERFERIHDTLKFGLGAFLIALSYYYIEDKFDGFIALIILQLIIAMIGIYTLHLFKAIYNIGSYIVEFIESISKEAKYHTMSREKKEKLNTINDKQKKGSNLNWGSDSRFIGFVLSVLLIISIFVIIKKSKFLENLNIEQLSKLNIEQWFLIIISIAIIIYNIYLIIKCFTMKTFMGDNMNGWKNYKKLLKDTKTEEKK